MHRRIIGYFLMFTALFVFLLPDMVSFKNQVDVKAYVMDYGSNHAQEDEVLTDELLLKCRVYNASLAKENQPGLDDIDIYSKGPVFLDEDEAFAYIEIPAMNQSFKLYLGASQQHLSEGLAVMGMTSIPIGGLNTNTVIAGHRGYNQLKTFLKDIDLIAKGDEIKITNPWETLTYEVTERKIIEPDDFESIRIVEGKDLLTLITCHPYGQTSTSRYVVIAERKTIQKEIIESTESELKEINLRYIKKEFEDSIVRYLMIIVLLILIIESFTKDIVKYKRISEKRGRNT